MGEHFRAVASSQVDIELGEKCKKNKNKNKNAGLRSRKYNKKPQLEQLNKDALFAGPLSV